MHEYIAKFGDMAEHAYSIKPINSASIILASNFIEGVQNPHVKNKFRSYQVKNLEDIFCHAIHEDQKQKIRALDFKVSSKPDPILNCTINAIKDEACSKCGSKGHFIKDCPLSQQDNMAQKSKYTDHRTDTNSTTDKVMEPLTRLFTDLVEQLKLLTPSGHSPHNGPPNYEGNARHGHKWMGFHNSHRLHGNGNYHRQDNAQKDCSIDHHHQTSFKWNGHQWDSRNGVGNKSKFTKRPHTSIHETGSGSECNSECSVASDFEEHLEKEAVPTPVSSKKLIYPSQVIENAPESLRGSTFCEENIRYSTSHVNTSNIGSETEIAHIGRKSQNKYTVIVMIGARSQKALWDFGVGRCIISYDCHNSLHP